jgi:hypothetical protein
VSTTVPAALDRIADALLALAKANRDQNKLAARSVDVAEAMLAIHTQGAATSRALEQSLLMQGDDNGDAGRTN